MSGVREGDFTMVFGFPGRTTEYLPASAVEQIMKVNDPAKIGIRATALGIMDAFMRKDEQIKIQYASKYAGIENAYKKWQGEVLGLTRSNAIDKKKEYEEEFQKKVAANPQWKTNYGTVLQDLNNAYAELKPFGFARDYFLEIVSKIELFTMAGQLSSLVNAYDQGGEAAYQKKKNEMLDFMKGFFPEHNTEVDKKLFAALMKMYVNDQQAENVSPMVKERSTNGNFDKMADNVYSETFLLNQRSVDDKLKLSTSEAINFIRNDIAIKLYNDILRTYQSNVQGRLNEIQTRLNKLQRIYMQAQMDVFKEKKFYPDANSTLRVTYGNVKGYDARDAVKYDFYTYLDGVMEKYKPGDYEFDVPEKLRTLYQTKDYGPYAQNGKLPVCFIAANHTTGGNSGSPALDGNGYLIGLNFDRVWEGTMSDINYDPTICRNIMVDIRYVLFIIDKFAGAKHLIKEMNLANAPKSPLFPNGGT